MAANLMITPIAAPATRTRLTPDALRGMTNERAARYASAGEVILNTKREQMAMLKWLYSKGICIDPSTTYDDYQLLQLILFWHLCEPWMQQKIGLMRPVFYIETPRHVPGAGDRNPLTHSDAPGEGFWMKGGLDACLLEDGTVANVIRCSGTRFYRPTDEEIPSRVKLLLLDKMKVSKTYDAGIATIYHRYDLGYLVSQESVGPANLYGCFFFAHEMTHGIQNLFSPLYDLECRMVDARTRFLLLANFDNPSDNPARRRHVMIYRRGGDANPNDGLSVTQRPIRRADRSVEVPHPQAVDEVYAYLAGITLELEQGPKMRPYFESNGIEVVNGRISPVHVLKKIYDDIQVVFGPLTSNQMPDPTVVFCHGPSTNPVFVEQYQHLRQFLSNKFNPSASAPVPDEYLPALGAISPVPYPADDRSFIDTFWYIIERNAARLNVSIVARLKDQLRAVQNTGLAAVRSAVPLWLAKVDRAVAMQRQQMALFPTLIGSFTNYSNKIFKDSVFHICQELGPIFNKKAKFEPAGRYDSAGDRFALLSQDIKDAILAHPLLRDDAPDEDAAAKVTPLEWYALGAPLGFFNVYTQEYDAEAYAMWLCCPEEFLEMYTRPGSFAGSPDRSFTEEVLNQATYASKRGIQEVGLPPRYIN